MAARARSYNAGAIIASMNVVSTANAYFDSAVTLAEGTQYFHVRPKNGAGTWGTERIFTVQYDKTNPAVSATGASATWYTSNPTITRSASDAASGLSYAKHAWDSSDATCRPTGPA